MAQFKKVLDIWTADVSTLQVGQWVFAGTDTPKGRGRFLGVKEPSKTIVVAWQGNAQNSDSHTGYTKSLRQYALGS